MREDMRAEAYEVIRVISLYRALLCSQLISLFPQKDPLQIKRLIEKLVKSNRIFYHPDTDLVTADPKCETDITMIKSFWVLLDVLDRITFHAASDFPVTVSMFTQDDLFEVIYVPYDQESLVNYAVSTMLPEEEASRKLVVIEKTSQIPYIKIPNTRGYCKVDYEGGVSYYRPKEDEIYEQQSFE